MAIKGAIWDPLPIENVCLLLALRDQEGAGAAWDIAWELTPEFHSLFESEGSLASRKFHENLWSIYIRTLGTPETLSPEEAILEFYLNPKYSTMTDWEKVNLVISRIHPDISLDRFIERGDRTQIEATMTLHLDAALKAMEENHATE